MSEQVAEVKVLSDDALHEIDARYEKRLPIGYLETAIGHMSGGQETIMLVMQDVPALRETIRALQAEKVWLHDAVNSTIAGNTAQREQITTLTAEWCECGHPKTQHEFFSDHDECYECDQMSDDLCCHWRAAPRSTDTNTGLCEQLAQSRAENERLSSQLKEWQEEKDTKAGYL